MISDRLVRRESRNYEHPRDSLSRLGVPLSMVLIGLYLAYLRFGETLWANGPIIAEKCREVR
jgi:hypothetical protein